MKITRSMMKKYKDIEEKSESKADAEKEMKQGEESPSKYKKMAEKYYSKKQK